MSPRFSRAPSESSIAAEGRSAEESVRVPGKNFMQVSSLYESSRRRARLETCSAGEWTQELNTFHGTLESGESISGSA